MYVSTCNLNTLSPGNPDHFHCDHVSVVEIFNGSRLDFENFRIKNQLVKCEMGVKQYDSFIGSPEFPGLELMNEKQNIYIHTSFRQPKLINFYGSESKGWLGN